MSRFRGVRIERWAIRIVVPLALAGSVLATAALPVPSQPPDLSLRSESIFHVERALLFFYGFMFALVPVVRSLREGELPVEVSMRGARYREVASDAERTITTMEDELDKLRVSVRHALAAGQKATEEVRLLSRQVDDLKVT